MKEYQKQWLETVQDFIGLWDRFDTLYLRGITSDEVTEERENEYVQFQGAMVEQLVKLVEIEHKRFDAHDQVMAVIYDAPSLRALSRQSDFQRKRLHQRWGEVSEMLSKLRQWCETYTPKLDKTNRLAEVRRLNPFWNPAGGVFTSTLMKLAVGPVTFFQGLRPGHEKKTNWFLFKVLIIPVLMVLLVLAITHLETVQQMGANFGETAGIMPTREGFVANLLIHVFALLGILVLSLVGSVVLMLLAFLHVGTLHLMVKLFGGKEKLAMTHKIIVYGVAPIAAIITAPYAIVLEIIGVNRTQKVPVVLAPFAWLFSTALVIAIVFGLLFGTYHFTGQIPSEGEYIQVTGIGAKTYEPLRRSKERVKPDTEIPSGIRLDYKGDEQKKLAKGSDVVDFYRVVYDGKRTLVRQEDGELREFRRSQLVSFVLELTWEKASYAVRWLSREVGAEAD